MNECLKRLIHYEHIFVWVLENKNRPRESYINTRYNIDGESKVIKVLQDY